MAKYTIEYITEDNVKVVTTTYCSETDIDKWLNMLNYGRGKASIIKQED